jgi:hypothetical protein
MDATMASVANDADAADQPAASLLETLVCPITHEVAKAPVIAADGQLYDLEAIDRWLRENGTSPLTLGPIPRCYTRPAVLVALHKMLVPDAPELSVGVINQSGHENIPDTAMRTAAARGDIAETLERVRQGADARVALCIAVACMHTALVDALIAHDASLLTVNLTRPMEYAFARGLRDDPMQFSLLVRTVESYGLYYYKSHFPRPFPSNATDMPPPLVYQLLPPVARQSNWCTIL